MRLLAVLALTVVALSDAFCPLEEHQVNIPSWSVVSEMVGDDGKLIKKH